MGGMPEKPRRRRTVGPPAIPGERLIRKYGNRRLYDTRESRYVTLEDLVEVFDRDDAVRVVDAVTGEDLTKRVLAQAILFEEERRRSPIIPIELLRALLRHRGDRDGYERRLRRALESLDQRPDQRPDQKAPAEPPPRAPPQAGELDELKRRLQALETQLKRPAVAAPAPRRR